MRAHALLLLLLLLLGAAAGAAAASAAASLTAPQQVHLTLHPDADTLVAQWHALALTPGAAAVLQYGASRGALPHEVRGGNGSAFAYVVDTCPSNSTRASFFVAFPAPRYADTFYRVSSDGGASWSAVFGPTRAPAPLRADGSVTISLFGDFGIETAPAANALSALINDTQRGGHQLVVHFGDTAYNMNDECGAKGDRFLNAAQDFAATTPVAWGNGNHETGPEFGPFAFDYHEFIDRLAPGQAFLAKASNSTSVRWYSFFVEGTAAFFMLDADAWIYPAVFGLVQGQWEWLAAQLPLVNRTRYPWLIVVPHRAMYCTKTKDAECNSEAAALRDGQLGLFWGLEPLLIKHGVDMVFAGHTHHYEATWPVAKGASTQRDYVNPRATVHVQSGIAGTGPGGDPFDVPQQEWERIRDTSFSPSYGQIIFHNATHLTYQQLFCENATVFDTFVIQQSAHGPFAA